MRASPQILVAVLTLCLFSDSAMAFGTKRTHEELADSSIDRADAFGVVSSYLRDELGLAHGVGERLAIQLGLDSLIDQDFDRR
jgi:hypothetical protein